MKRKIDTFSFNVLERELKYLESIGRLESGQTSSLLEEYDVPTAKERKKMNMLTLLFWIGGILIGLSLLSFVASNWAGLSDLTKYVILVSLLIVLLIGGKMFETKQQRLSQILFLVSFFTFGANIFYIGQLFHLGGKAEDAFLWWGIGMLPLAFYLQNRYYKFASLALIYLFVETKLVNNEPKMTLLVLIALFALMQLLKGKERDIVLFVNLFMAYQYVQLYEYFQVLESNEFPWLFTALLPALFVFGHKTMNKSNALFVVHMVMTIQAFIAVYVYFDINEILSLVLLLFVVGLVLTHKPIRDYKEVSHTFGMILQFITALVLSFSDLWGTFFTNADDLTLKMMAVTFSVLYCIYAIRLMMRNQLFGVFIICVFVFRFYVDLSLQFASKSLAFLIGGVLFIALGYWFERKRKEVASHDHIEK